MDSDEDEYYYFYDENTTSYRFIRLNRITNKSYDAITGTEIIGSNADDYKTEDKLDKDTFELLLGEQKALNSPILFTSGLDILGSIVEEEAVLNENIYNEENREALSALLELKGEIVDKKGCPIKKPIKFQEGNYSFDHVVQYINENFSFFNLKDISLEGKDIPQEYLEKYINESSEIISIEESIRKKVKEGDKKLDRIVAIYGFYRSYIDLYHDILKYGDIYCDFIYKAFLNSGFFTGYESEKLEFIRKIQTIQQTIKTSGNEVNQIRCRKLLEQLVDEYIHELHKAGITWIPKKKEEARILSIDIKETCDIDILIQTLKNDGVDSFYVESANSSIGKRLVNLKKDETDKLDLTDIHIGNWNAGSGFSSGVQKYILQQRGGARGVKKKKSERESERESERVAERASERVNERVNERDITEEQRYTYCGPKTKMTKIDSSLIQVYTDSLEVSLFNLFDISVCRNNNKLISRYDDKYITLEGGPHKLSVNSILKTLGHPILRSTSGLSAEDKKIKELHIKTTSTGNNVRISPYNSMLASLKTWTDLVQITALSLSKSIKIKKGDTIKNFKTAVVISDYLCETTARMYGLGHVLLNAGKTLHYYSYDTNSRKLSKEQIEGKLNIYMNILSQKEKIVEFIEKWFDDKIVFIQKVIENTPDSKLYFVLNMLLKSYSDMRNSFQKYLDIYDERKELSLEDLKNIPDSFGDLFTNITESNILLSDFINITTRFTEELAELYTLQTRGGKDKILDIYATIKQLIVDTYIKKISSETSDETDKMINAYTSISMAYKMLSHKRGFDMFITPLKGAVKDTFLEDNIYKCNGSAYKTIYELILDIQNSISLEQIIFKLHKVLEEIYKAYDKSNTSDNLQFIYNLLIAVKSGKEYYNKTGKNPVKDNIIFRDFLDFCLNDEANGIKNKVFIESGIIKDTTSDNLTCKKDYNNTLKVKRYSTTKKHNEKSRNSHSKTRRNNSLRESIKSKESSEKIKRSFSKTSKKRKREE